MVNQNIVYGGLAALLLLVIAFAFYSFGETQAIKTKLDGIDKKTQSSSLAVTGLDKRLADLEGKFSKQTTYSKLIAFYDSSCTQCSNEGFLQGVEASKGNLEKQGILLQPIDLKDDPNPAIAVNVNMAPAFFASATDLALNSKLVDFMNALPQASFALKESSIGVTAFPPSSHIILSTQSCAKNGTVKLEEFYSPTSPFARRVFYGNGSAFNDNSSAIFAEVSGEALAKVEKAYGEKINSSSYCIGIHTKNENSQVLNVNASDETLCKEEVGEEAYKESDRLANEYGIFGTPMFVVDCKYVTKVRDSARLENAICAFRPDICGRTG